MTVRITNDEVRPYVNALRGGLEIALTARSPRHRILISDAEGWLKLERHDYRNTNLGRAFLDPRKGPTKINKNNAHHLRFVKLFSAEELDHVETVRDGDSLELELEVEIRGDRWTKEGEPAGDPFVQRERRQMTIERSRWVEKFLDPFGYGDYEIWEIRFPTTPRPPSLQDEAAMLNQALTDYNRGDYKDCFSDCRDLLESISAKTGKGDLDLEGLEESELWAYAKNFFSKALHPEPRREGEPNRHDAEMALSMARAVYRRVAHAVSRE